MDDKIDEQPQRANEKSQPRPLRFLFVGVCGVCGRGEVETKVSPATVSITFSSIDSQN